MSRYAEDFLLRKEDKSPYWYYRLKGWKSFKSTGQKTKAAAKKVTLDAWKEKEDSGIKSGPVTLGQFAGSFFDWDSPWCVRQAAKGRLQSSTAVWRKGLLKNQILPRFRNSDISTLTPGQIDHWLMALPVADRTKEHVRTTMRIIFREAMRERIIQSNPMDYIERLKVVSESNEPPNMDELRLLFPPDKDQFRKVWPLPHYGVMCAVTASSGLRMQEVRALTPKSLVMDKQGIVVAQAVKCTGEIGLPKADEIRVVLAPHETMDLLAWWIRVTNRHNPDELLFPGRTGDPIVSGVKPITQSG